MIQGAWRWCTGMTQRDGMEREVGVGFRMGNTCTPMADSSHRAAKPIQYCKVKFIYICVCVCVCFKNKKINNKVKKRKEKQSKFHIAYFQFKKKVKGTVFYILDTVLLVYKLESMVKSLIFRE